MTFPTDKKLKELLERRLNAEEILMALAAPPQHMADVNTTARAFFLLGLQEALDLITSVKTRPLSVESNPIIALATLTVDHLLASLHLVQRAYINQAYSLLRDTLNNADLIQLFTVEPKMADLWASEVSNKQKRKELKPATVRTKLGKPKQDEFVDFFAGLSAHPDFPAIQMRGGLIKRHSETEQSQLRLYVGGAPLEVNFMVGNAFCLYALETFLFALRKSQIGNGAPLNYQGIFLPYIREQFIPWLKNQDQDIGPFEKVIKNDVPNQ